MIDRGALAAILEPGPLRTAEVERAIDASAAHLASDRPLDAIERDPYMPKWDSPWWHMLLLHQLGEARRIPARVAAAMAAAVERDHGLCLCALGTMSQVLAACGVDVDAALPRVEPWLVQRQMTDGGLNCDETAYQVPGEAPSSMVATAAALEAMLLGDASRWSGARRAFVDRAARCILDRALVRGSATRHNAEERQGALLWPRLVFPRFYFHDVLRGLSAVVDWAERTGQALPAASIEGVVSSLVERFPDGVVRVERRIHADEAESTFPLLEAVSRVGAPSEALSREWSATRAGLFRLLEERP